MARVFNGKEVKFEEHELIVSKTDLKGMITYANDVFVRLCGYREDELLGKAHNIIRHPLMPRCVFKLLWDTLKSGNEIFAYVVNQCKNGDYYWVFAHVTPTLGPDGSIIGYHSNRRVPKREAIDKIIPLYDALLTEEEKHKEPKKALDAGFKLLEQQLKNLGISYDELVLSL